MFSKEPEFWDHSKPILEPRPWIIRFAERQLTMSWYEHYIRAFMCLISVLFAPITYTVLISLRIVALVLQIIGSCASFVGDFWISFTDKYMVPLLPEGNPLNMPSNVWWHIAPKQWRHRRIVMYLREDNIPAEKWPEALRPKEDTHV